QTVEQLYKTAFEYSDLPSNSDRYICYDVHDTLQYRINPRMMLDIGDDLLKDNWRNDNQYCYNLVLPKQCGFADVSKRMLHDLNDFFGSYLNIKVIVEEREVRALAIIRVDSS